MNINYDRGALYDEIFNTLLGIQLKQARNDKRLSMDNVASQVGLSKMSISRYENGTNKPTEDILIKLCGVLNLNCEDLISYVDSQAIKQTMIEETCLEIEQNETEQEFLNLFKQLNSKQQDLIIETMKMYLAK